MSAQWTGDIIGKMHIHHIQKKRLAEQIGVTPEYLSMVVHGHRSPPGAEQRFRSALDALIAEQDTKQNSPMNGQ